MPTIDYSPETVTFVITVLLKPDREQAFLDLLTPVLDAMRHETTFVDVVLHRDPENPRRLMLYETWTSMEDVVEVQMHRDYRQAYWAALPDLLEAERRVEVWKPLRGDFARQ